MTHSNPGVVDLVVSAAAPTPQTVEQRIKRRLEVLRSWLNDGIPIGKEIPPSLNEVRRWEDSELAIEPIGSPNEFTTTHAKHGRSVAEIDRLLEALRARYARPAKAARRTKPAAKFDRQADSMALESAISQWHTERDQHLASGLSGIEDCW